MLGNIVGRAGQCLTDESGNMVVSFVVDRQDAKDARKVVQAMKEAKDKGKDVLRLTVDVNREKRSVNANAYFWTLCDKLAQKLGTDKQSLYVEYIKQVGVFKGIQVNSEAAATIEHVWKERGVGWVVAKVDEGINGMTAYHLYYGSSVYNTKQMSRLIDLIVSDCKDQGIETMTPEELAAMLALWEDSR